MLAGLWDDRPLIASIDVFFLFNTHRGPGIRVVCGKPIAAGICINGTVEAD